MVTIVPTLRYNSFIAFYFLTTLFFVNIQVIQMARLSGSTDFDHYKTELFLITIDKTNIAF